MLKLNLKYDYVEDVVENEYWSEFKCTKCKNFFVGNFTRHMCKHCAVRHYNESQNKGK